MKKQLALLLALGLTFTMFASCGKKDNKKEQDTGSEQTTESDIGGDTGSESGEHTHDYDALGNCKNCEETLSDAVTLESFDYGVYEATVKGGKVYLNYTAVCNAGGFYVDLSQLDGCNADAELAVKYITDIEIYKEGTTTNLVTDVHKGHDGDCWFYMPNMGNCEIGTTYYAVIDLVDTYQEDTIELYMNIDCLSHYYEDGVCEFCGVKKVEENANYGSYTGNTVVITGRGTLLEVLVQKGTIEVGNTVKLVKEDGTTVVFTSNIAGIELNKQQLETATAEQTVGVLIRSLDSEVDLTQVKYIVCE